MTQQELLGGLFIKQLPLATYLGLAQKHGLRLVADDNTPNHSEILCGVLKKA
ncbi:MAG TPA: hypothetical protein VK694_07995 [Verrucomicrobiae bacterium]|nr:hypothetical protein [Verrucomicrobiae bacterium]